MNISQAEISQIIIQRTLSIEFKLVNCMLPNESFIAFLPKSYWTFSIVIKLFYHLFLNMSFTVSLLKSHNPYKCCTIEYYLYVDISWVEMSPIIVQWPLSIMIKLIHRILVNMSFNAFLLTSLKCKERLYGRVLPSCEYQPSWDEYEHSRMTSLYQVQTNYSHTTECGV
jgi:hypothetical protein